MEAKLPNVFFFLILFASYSSGKYVTAPGYKATKVADVNYARGLAVDDAGDVLVVGRTARTVIALTETDNEDIISTIIIEAREQNINHGIVYHDGYIYASSVNSVYRWPYQAGSRKLVKASPELVITNMYNGTGTPRHTTRTLVFDKDSRLYVSIGSADNVDLDSTYARIRRFTLNPSEFPYDFTLGEVFADGLRNEVGIAFSPDNILWGVENGADQLVRDDLGGDIHNGNPAEELHRFGEEQRGGFHGYPYCFSTYNLTGYFPGTQFAWPTTMNDGIHTDVWCQNYFNNIPPTMVLPAHEAPLGIEFHTGQGCSRNESVKGAFPCSSAGDAFVPYHGSWNSDLKVGYRVAQLEFTKTGRHAPTGNSKDIIYEASTTTCRFDCFRPVNAVFNHKGHMFISLDETNEILRVTYENE